MGHDRHLIPGIRVFDCAFQIAGLSMFVYLAQSGGRVVIPDAVALLDGDSEDEVCFIDASQRVVAVFRRQDVALYSLDDLPESPNGNVTEGGLRAGQPSA